MSSTPNVTDDSVLWAEKDKDASLNYAFKLDQVLDPADNLSAVSWSVTPDGLGVSDLSFDGKNVRAVFSGGTPKSWYAVKFSWASQAGLADEFVVRVYITEDQELVSALGTALFPNRFSATSRLRRDRLTMLANSLMPDVDLSDDYLWEKLRAAESEVAHTLRVPLQPTRFFPRGPTPDQLAVIGDMPWGIDPSYDYSPADWYGDRWGMITTRQKPIQQIVSMKFVYPTPQQTIVDVPADWIRSDRKYGQIQIVPVGTQYPMMLGGMFMSLLTGGKTLPFSIDLIYDAGLANAARDFPELVDAVKKLAVVKIIEDAYMPQSGSISADGLSQSLSVDVSKYEDSVQRILQGADGNGGLMAKIHGIRTMVI